jgi:hypothetical protein
MNAIFIILLSLSSIVFISLFTNNLTLIFAENSIENSQNDWIKYTNQTYGFTLEYPSSWLVKEYHHHDKDKGIFNFMIGQLTKNISYENFTGSFAFRSFGKSGFSFGTSQFDMIPIDDIGFLTDIVKNMVKKIIIDNYNLNLTFLNNSKIQKLNDEQIGTFTFQIDNPIKDIFITTIVTNHNNNTLAFFLLGTKDQFKNSYIIENLNHMLNSIKWIDKNSKTETSITNNSRNKPVLTLFEADEFNKMDR